MNGVDYASEQARRKKEGLPPSNEDPVLRLTKLRTLINKQIKEAAGTCTDLQSQNEKLIRYAGQDSEEADTCSLIAQVATSIFMIRQEAGPMFNTFSLMMTLCALRELSGRILELEKQAQDARSAVKKIHDLASGVLDTTP